MSHYGDVVTDDDMADHETTELSAINRYGWGTN